MRASAASGGGRLLSARWEIGEDVAAVAPRDTAPDTHPPTDDRRGAACRCLRARALLAPPQRARCATNEGFR
jgi:hypothetical protein